MIQALQELLINPLKHDKGKPIFEYYETMSEEEQFSLVLDYYAAITFVYKLIKKSKKIRDP